MEFQPRAIVRVSCVAIAVGGALLVGGALAWQVIHDQPAPEPINGCALAPAEPPAEPAPPACADDDSDEVEAPAIEPRNLVLQAQDEYVHGQYRNAIEHARQGLAANPSRGWRIIGAASCFLKERDAAMQAWRHLEPQGRQFLKYVCARNAVRLP